MMNVWVAIMFGDLVANQTSSKAFLTLVKLRQERVLASMELCSIYYQIQVERWLFSRKVYQGDEANHNPFSILLGRTGWRRRVENMIRIPRIRRAAISAMIVLSCIVK